LYSFTARFGEHKIFGNCFEINTAHSEKVYLDYTAISFSESTNDILSRKDKQII
jgi:hypothetical protein